MLHLASAALMQSEPTRAVGYADEAIDSLSDTSSHVEISAALMTKASGLTMLGLHDLASVEIVRALALKQTEAVLERADLADTYFNPEDAGAWLDKVDDVGNLNSVDRWIFHIHKARYLSRRKHYDEATSLIQEIDPRGDGPIIGQRTARLGSLAYIAVAAGLPDCAGLISEASRAARLQGAESWRQITELLRAYHERPAELSAAVRSVGGTAPWSVTFIADVLVRTLDDLDESAVAVIMASARLHQGRWRFVLRAFVDAPAMGSGLAAARVLESIGDRSDIGRLRAFARRNRRLAGASQIGRGLARALAHRVFVEDQNRTAVLVGDRQIPGSSVRRKVLALLCFLLSRPGLASTRDQVLEALWPELDPLDAVNSLNQTVYFLRRVLEESYVDDLSPGYVHHDSELIWLDRELVTSRSNDCRNLILALPDVPTPDQVSQLIAAYEGRFALDFEYEEWSNPYRDWLHASFLEVVERALTADIETGHFERGIRLARRVLDIDPGAEQVELSLLRLYRASGAHAAAAEQYGHYAGVLRDELGVEPPPLDSL
jgi:DNA-binding SARP family transcriptional activator